MANIFYISSIMSTLIVNIYSRIEVGDAYWRPDLLLVVTWEQNPRKLVGLLRPGSLSLVYTQYINAPKMTLCATRG